MCQFTIIVHVDEAALAQSIWAEYTCTYNVYTCLHSYMYVYIYIVLILHRSLPIANVDVQLVPLEAEVKRTERNCDVEGTMYAW